MAGLVFLTKFESKFRPFAPLILPPKQNVSLYSKGRLHFMKMLENENLGSFGFPSPKSLKRVLWGIEFQSPIFNAAGMFKNGECYELVARQGAGAYIAGTTTSNARVGNTKEGIHLPFVPYPRSKSASNWLGLPNHGDEIVAQRLSQLKRFMNCPVGVSTMTSPDLQGEERLTALVNGLALYAEAGVDFIEINESCPNTGHAKLKDDSLASRLLFIKENFLDVRQSRLPVIVKFSNDVEISRVPELLDLLFENNFDGVNFGNTSTNYEKRKHYIHPKEQRLFEYYTKTFGGGISGRPLAVDSLVLASSAVDYVRNSKPKQEFHIIRTGGISSAEDLIASEAAGVSLNQWFTGYFDKFSDHGHELYMQLYKEFESLKQLPETL